MAYCLSTGTTVCCRASSSTNGASASLSLLTGSGTRNSVSLNFKPKAPTFPGMLLHCSFTPSSLSFSSGGSSFGGFGLGLDMNSSLGTVGNKRRGGFVVRASKYRLCQTKRNRSRKSLARTHGFRKRMSTTSGRAVLKRRRAKGRWALCTKTNPCSGKRRI